MTRRELCLRTFPDAWRSRYGDELRDLLADDERSPLSQDLDVLRAGLRERARRPRAGALWRVGALVPAACTVAAVIPAVLAPATTTLPDAVSVALVPTSARPAAPRPVAIRRAPASEFVPARRPPLTRPLVQPVPGIHPRTARTGSAAGIALPLVAARPRPG